MTSCRHLPGRSPILRLTILAPLVGSLLQAGATDESQARRVLEEAIQAMGGAKYRAVKTETEVGREFVFNKGRKAFLPYHSWTVYQDPVRFRFQAFQGKRQSVQVYNLELEKGWDQEGFHTIEEKTPEDLKSFREMVKRDLHYVLRNRLQEDGISLFYYGPSDIAGSGEMEAVEVLDKTNASVIIYFNIESNLPVRMESQVTTRAGIRQKSETEFFNWHVHQGINAPMTIHYYRDGEKSGEKFVESILYDAPIPADYFLKPTVSAKKAAKAKKRQKKKLEKENDQR